MEWVIAAVAVVAVLVIAAVVLLVRAAGDTEKAEEDSKQSTRFPH